MKLACLISGSEKSRRSIDELSAKFDFVDPDDADVIVALGGDGFLLHTIHETFAASKPIYGMNCGTVGFLLNEYSSENLLGRIENAQSVILPSLRIDVETTEGEAKSLRAFNEMAVVRYSSQSLNLRVTIDGRTQLEKFVGDGLILATPAGSTAYNLAVRGPVLPLQANVLALTPVSPFRPRRWNGAVVPSSIELQLEVLDPAKRPAGAAGDFVEVRNIARVRAVLDQESVTTVLFDPHQSLEDRIASEQFYES